MKVTVFLFAIALASVGCNSKLQDSTFRIIATDKGFEAPGSIPSGIRHIVMENQGTEIHESMLVKLPPGMSVDGYVAAVRRGSLFPKGALDYSGAGLTSPGERAELWLKVDPGNYILICWNDGHAKKIPPHPFTVDNSIVNDDVPKEDVVAKLVDYRFDLEGNLRSGPQVIRIETPGPSMHEMDLFRLHPDKSAADLIRWRKDDGRGPAPAEALGGALDSHDIHRVVWLRHTFAPGHYVLHCEMPVDTKDDLPKQEITHSDLGMVREFEIRE